MKRIAVVVTARPSYSRVRSTLHALRSDPGVELLVIAAASSLLERYGCVVDTIEADGFEVADRLYTVVEGGGPSRSTQTVALGLLSTTEAFERLKPDCVVTLADRYETMATAIAATYLNIPLVHIQGGEFTGNIDNKVRHAITKLADLHLVASQIARKRVISMGEDPERVVVTGCPSVDIAASVKRAFSGRDDAEAVLRRHGGVGPNFGRGSDYLVVMQHPVTSEYAASREQAEVLLDACAASDLPVIWFWPNVDAGSDGTSKALRLFRERNPTADFRFFKNLPPEDFLTLLLGCRALVGNSSVGIRECSFLGVPVVNIGSRQVGRERGGNVVDVGYDANEIRGAIQEQASRGLYPEEHIYGDGRAGPRLAKWIANCDGRIEKFDFCLGEAMDSASDWSRVDI
ncbi:UDP-N-acetylglucosamine 2-epimerase [bacterium]|nr:UDP-N-acetylglucosamine 2-epimerase [bacterium]